MSAFPFLRACLMPAITLAVLGVQPLSAQDAPASETPPSGIVLKKTVRRVVLDVVVTGPNLKAIHGLTQQDFSVTEDGTPQQVLSFEAHEFGSTDYVPPKLPPLPPNTYIDIPSEPEREPLNLILYDRLNTSLDDQMVARAQLIKFIRHRPPGSRFAIFVLDDRLRMIQGFTDDENELFAAVNSRSTWPRLPSSVAVAPSSDRHGGASPGRGDAGKEVAIDLAEYKLTGRVDSSLDSFLKIARFLAGFPGRKNLIWLSSSFPTTLFPTDTTTGSGPPGAGLGSSQDYGPQIKEVTNTLTLGQIAVYPVDVRGVVGWGESRPIFGCDYCYLYFDYKTEDDIADATGGHAFYSDNELSAAIDDAVENGSTYYALSYSPTNQDYDGKLRKIRVKISKKGYRLAYRRSYFGDDPNSPNPHAVQLPSDALYANMQHGAPMAHELFFSAHIYTSGAPALATPEQMAQWAEMPAYADTVGKKKTAKPPPPVHVQPYTVEYTVPTRQFRLLEESSEQPTLELAAAVFDADGNELSSIVQRVVDTRSAPERLPFEQKIYRVQQQVDVPLKAVSLRIAVRDVTTDHIGALEVPLPLPPEPETQALPSAGGHP
jgi:VWFA-related protein